MRKSWIYFSEEIPELHVTIEVMQDNVLIKDVDVTRYNDVLRLRKVHSPWNISVSDFKQNDMWRYQVKKISIIQKIKKLFS
ncbi:MAG: hypothetical protein WAT79_08770 [Saprospiraceae bacterium]